MATLFFDHLIEIDEVIIELDSYSVDPAEIEELKSLIDQIIHHEVLNLVLNHLPKSDHEEFITLLSNDPSDISLINYLKSKVSVDIESQISDHGKRLKEDLKNEIKRSKLKKSS